METCAWGRRALPRAHGLLMGEEIGYMNKRPKDIRNLKERRKLWKDVKEGGFGIYDCVTRRRVNPHGLAFIWADRKGHHLREEVVVLRDLRILERIYKKKYGTLNIGGSMDLGLFNENIEGFVERLIRAVEICTLRHTLSLDGGGLNTRERQDIVKGHRSFLWKD